jgi:hypothetical protein
MSVRPLGGDAGAALILALMISGLLAALGLSVLLVADAERRMAAHANHAWATLGAADAALERVLIDLRTSADWSPYLEGRQRSDFAGMERRAVLPAGGTWDLDAATATLQAETFPAGSYGADTPIWRLVAWGALADLAEAGAVDSLQYLIVWIADDPSDNDGNPLADQNGAITVRAEARGRPPRQAGDGRAGDRRRNAGDFLARGSVDGALAVVLRAADVRDLAALDAPEPGGCRPA